MFNEFGEFGGFGRFIDSLPPRFISPSFLFSPIGCPFAAIGGTEGIIAGDCIEEAGEEARNGRIDPCICPCICPCIEAEGGTDRNWKQEEGINEGGMLYIFESFTPSIEKGGKQDVGGIDNNGKGGHRK